jgi:muramoyltetrapeptide carboxypeptidase
MYFHMAAWAQVPLIDHASTAQAAAILTLMVYPHTIRLAHPLVQGYFFGMGIKPRAPRALKSGDTVALVAPSFHFDAERFQEGKKLLTSLGLRVVHAPGVEGRHGLFAATPRQRVQDLLRWCTDPQVSAIMGIRGGYGCAEIYPEFKRQLSRIRGLAPKIFVGYSDLTILLNGLLTDFGWMTFHGPMVVGRPFREPHPLELKTLKHCLFEGGKPLGAMGGHGLETLIPGKAAGRLMGGCLTVLSSVAGTDLQQSARGKILFLEDIGEAPYRLRRALQQMRASGALKGVRGIIVGTLTDCMPHADPYKNVSAKDVFREMLADLDVPVLWGFPGGHGPLQCTFPLGAKVEMVAPTRGKAVVRFTEAASL